MKAYKSVVFYECPVCGKSSTDHAEIERHFKQHEIKTDEIIYCNICGAGWRTKPYGKEVAVARAKECYKKHIADGNIDEVAAKSFFLSGGCFGYPAMIGGNHHERNKNDPG